MSTHVTVFQSFFRFLYHFVLAKLASSSLRVKSVCHSQGLSMASFGTFEKRREFIPSLEFLFCHDMTYTSENVNIM